MDCQIVENYIGFGKEILQICIYDRRITHAYNSSDFLKRNIFFFINIHKCYTRQHFNLNKRNVNLCHSQLHFISVSSA